MTLTVEKQSKERSVMGMMVVTTTWTAGRQQLVGRNHESGDRKGNVNYGGRERLRDRLEFSDIGNY